MKEKQALRVELRSAKIPYLGLIADHFWFVIFNHSAIDRWEVWQKPNSCRSSWGYIHQNLLPYDSGVGSGVSKLEYVFEGINAHRLVKVIYECQKNYQNRDTYYYWPGPNSNTYVQHILDKAKLKFCLPATAIGKDYYGLFHYSKDSNLFRLSCYFFGIKFIHKQFYEINLLAFSFGIHLRPFKIIHPFSRYITF